MSISMQLRGATLAATLAASSAGCVDVVGTAASGSFERTFDVDTPVELDVRTGSGRVTVRGGATDRMTVTGHIEVEQRLFGRSAGDAEALVERFETNPPVELSGRRVRVGVFDDPAYRRNVHISFDIEVPAATRVVSQTGSGSQEVTGVSGSVDVRTGSGSIRLTDVGGSAAAETGSGSIRAERIAGAFDGRTGSGSVTLVQTAPGDVDVSTGSGSAELRGVDGAARVRTGSGTITLDGRLGGDWDLETGSGSIRVRLPDDAAFELDASSASGRIRSAHAVPDARRDGERRRLAGSVRGGGSRLHLRTGSGDIDVD